MNRMTPPHFSSLWSLSIIKVVSGYFYWQEQIWQQRKQRKTFCKLILYFTYNVLIRQSVDEAIEFVKFGNYRSHYQCIYENVKTQEAEDTSTFEMLATISFNGPVFLNLQSTDESLLCGSSMWQYKVELSEDLFHRLDPVPANKAVFSVQ